MSVVENDLFLCFVVLRSKSTAMVIAGRSVHLTTLFSWASLNKQLTSNRAHTFACNWQQPFMNDPFSGRVENDRRNYFMINLHESMGPGRDRTHYPWICSQLRICNQTRHRMRYAARYIMGVSIRSFLLAGGQTCQLFENDLFLCFVVLRPKSTAMVMAGQSVHLTTLFPGQAWTSS